LFSEYVCKNVANPTALQTSLGGPAATQQCVYCFLPSKFLSSCHTTLSLLMAAKFGWGLCHMFPGLIGVVEFLNMFAKMLDNPTVVGSPVGQHGI
jgi:hypothetical protein